MKPPKISEAKQAPTTGEIRLDANRVPTFICIGGQRCGSTWLHLNLKTHPEIQMSAQKELNFFSKIIETNGVSEYYKHFDSFGSLRGESSPTYSAMFFKEIALLKQLIPQLKIIFIIRNPIERLSSQITRQWSYEKNNKLSGLFPLLREVDLSLSRRLTDYETIYRNWTHFYGEDNVLLIKYDLLKSSPDLFMKEVLSFLETDKDYSFPEDTFYKRQNKTKTHVIPEIPAILKWYIAREWLSKVKKMHQKLDIDLTDWVDSMESSLLSKRWYYPWIRLLHKLYFCIPYNALYRIINPLRISYRVFKSKRNILKALSP